MRVEDDWRALPLRRPEGGHGGGKLLEGDADWWSRARAAVVQSCWRNVKLCAEATPDRQHAEWDYALVLRNGIILSLECKSSPSTAEQKDLEARLQKLHEASSRLARMAVCVPLYSALADESWFGQLHELRLRIDEQPGRFALLPFTLPGQPASYEVRTAAGVRPHPCPQFEEALAGWMRP